MAEGGLLKSAQYNNKTKSTVLNYGIIIAKVIIITNIHTRNNNAVRLNTSKSASEFHRQFSKLAPHEHLTYKR